MISHISGTLLSKDLDHIHVMTAGGVGYLLHIPLSVFETLPSAGDAVQLHTSLVVKEDGWQLFGFASSFERRVFELALTANGVGPALALGLLSSLSATRFVRALIDKDINTLQGVPRVGRKKAERLVLDLADKAKILRRDGDANGIADGNRDGGRAAGAPSGAGADDAIRALVSLGYTNGDAERAVRSALDGANGGMPVAELIRSALAKVTTRA